LHATSRDPSLGIGRETLYKDGVTVAETSGGFKDYWCPLTKPLAITILQTVTKGEENERILDLVGVYRGLDSPAGGDSAPTWGKDLNVRPLRRR
jgi:hypothetical protein